MFGGVAWGRGFTGKNGMLRRVWRLWRILACAPVDQHTASQRAQVYGWVGGTEKRGWRLWRVLACVDKFDRHTSASIWEGEGGRDRHRQD